MGDGDLSTGDRIKLVGPESEDRLSDHSINAVQSRIKTQHPEISGLFNDEELRLFTDADIEKRFDYNSRVVQIFNTDYISTGVHWCTIVKEPKEIYQVWDSNIKVLNNLPYEVRVKLLSLSKASQRSISVEGANWKPTKYSDRVSTLKCNECKLHIKSDEQQVFLCYLCYSVYHERCRGIAFYNSKWPMCGNCDTKSECENNPSEMLDTTEPVKQLRYLDELADKYFSSIPCANGTKYFHSNIGTHVAEHPYLLIDSKENPIKLYDCSATHYPGIYSLSHDIEVALVHLSWPKLDNCQKMEILPAMQQTEENDCGVYASGYAYSFASGQTKYLLRLEMRQGIQDYVNKGTNPIIVERSKTIELDLSCKATPCIMTMNGQENPIEVDIYKCYFCKNWFHVGCSSPYHLYSTIYRRSCSDCDNIWESKHLEKGTAHIDESANNTACNQETDTTNSNMADSLGDGPPTLTTASWNEEET